MIDIIKKGNNIIECPDCGTQFTFESEDVAINILGLRVIRCPLCKFLIKLDKE
jgi:predicted Zn finger-like uncharacterized protein